MVSDGSSPEEPALSFRELLVAEIPNLRAFAVSLSGSMQNADDLVQDTLLKAWGHAESFAEGTSIRAWLFTILRNTYYSLYRKRGREVQDPEGVDLPEDLAAELGDLAERRDPVLGDREPAAHQRITVMSGCVASSVWVKT